MRPGILRVTSRTPDFEVGDLAVTVGRRWWRAYGREFWTVVPKRDAGSHGQYGRLTLLRDDECVLLPMPTPPPAVPFIPPRLLARGRLRWPSWSPAPRRA